MPLTAQQIVQAAAVIAKLPGGIQYSGLFLNLTLTDLWMNRDLKMNRVVETLAMPANTNGPITLAADYARTYDCFYMVNGMPFFMNQITQRQMDAEIIDPQVTQYPYEFSTDLSPLASQQPPTMTIYPQFIIPTDVTHRYMIRRPDIATPETSQSIPWFEDQDYLIHATATRMMTVTDDARWEKFVERGEQLLKKYLLMQGDEQRAVETVDRDPRRWRNTKSLPSTKQQPF